MVEKTRKYSKGTIIKFLFILLLPVGYALNYLSSLYPNQTERIYANGIYPVLAWAVSRLTGRLPFSVAEILLYALILYAGFCVVRLMIRLLKRKGERVSILSKGIINLLAWAGVLYFAFNLMWGFNYHRLPLSNILSMEVRPASSTELKALSEYLILQANDLRDKVPENDEGAMIPVGGVRGALDRVSLGFDAASVEYPKFAGADSRPKPVALSHYMAYTNIWGIYIPFTVEANVNTAIPLSLLPATIAHEMAHLRGFAREDEANYIAYLVCRMHPDDDFRYSGALFALTYAMDALAKHNRPAHQALSATLHEGVLRDLAEIRSFHQRFESPAREVFTKTNDLYLKANSQEDGERSYGRMVDLMIAEYRSTLP